MTAEELRAALDQFGLTMEQAAERLGIGVRSLYRYVAPPPGGRRVPRTIVVAIQQQQELRRIRTLVTRGSRLIW